MKKKRNNLYFIFILSLFGVGLLLLLILGYSYFNLTGYLIAGSCGNGYCEETETGKNCAKDCKIATISGLKKICKLTGKNSFNYKGTNMKASGTDNGYIFEHNGSMFFLFGDTKRASDGKYYPSVHASTRDLTASNCIMLNFSSVNELFKDVKDFYAKESNLQANECKNRGCGYENCCKEIDRFIYSNYTVHYYWSSTQKFGVFKGEFFRKADSIFDYYEYKLKSRSKVADYYARNAVRLAGYGVSFSDDISSASYRNSQEYNIHYSWANDKNVPLSSIKNEFQVKYNKIFDAINNKDLKQTLASRSFDNEFTSVTSSGISANNTIYVYFMSVKSWEPWEIYYTGIAYSRDNGKTFTRVNNLFDGNSNFAQVALVKEGDYLYLFGIPTKMTSDGKYGMKLARVETSKILNKKDYRFCKRNNLNKCEWVASENNASVILPPYFSASVQWNNYIGKWIMSYYSDKKSIDIREAKELQGPWSAPTTVVPSNYAECSKTADDRCYGAYMHLTYTGNNGRDIYFILTSWSDYNVNLFKARIN